MTPVQLDGSKSLWPSPIEYADWITAHEDEIYDAYRMADENAELIVIIIDQFADVLNTRAIAVLEIATERYIAQHYPEIAVIVESDE